MKQIPIAPGPHRIRLAAVLERNATIPGVRLDGLHDSLRECANIEFLPRYFQRLREIEKRPNDTVQPVDFVRYDSNFFLGLSIALNYGFNQSHARGDCV